MRCANLTGGEGKRIWLDARRTREENKPARCIHKAVEALSDLNDSIQNNRFRQPGPQPPYPTEVLTKDMKRFSVRTGEHGATICYYDPRRSEIVFTPVAIKAYTDIGRQSDLDQISAWCSLE